MWWGEDTLCWLKIAYILVYSFKSYSYVYDDKNAQFAIVKLPHILKCVFDNVYTIIWSLSAVLLEIISTLVAVLRLHQQGNKEHNLGQNREYLYDISTLLVLVYYSS